MKKKRALSASRFPDDYDTVQNGPVAQVKNIAQETGTITMTAEQQEMIRVTKDGFYVRGIRVPADDREAETVYNAFKEFLTYHALTRSY